MYIFIFLNNSFNFRFSYLKNYNRLSQSIFLYRKNIAKKNLKIYKKFILHKVLWG